MSEFKSRSIYTTSHPEKAQVLAQMLMNAGHDIQITETILRKLDGTGGVLSQEISKVNLHTTATYTQLNTIRAEYRKACESVAMEAVKAKLGIS